MHDAIIVILLLKLLPQLPPPRAQAGLYLQCLQQWWWWVAPGTHWTVVAWSSCSLQLCIENKKINKMKLKFYKLFNRIRISYIP